MLVINTIGNCIEFDFMAVPLQYNPTDLRFSCVQKRDLRALLPIDDNLGVRLLVNNDERFYLPYELVTSVNGVQPTSNTHLYQLIRTAYSQ
jgi:hypothetical protein